MNVKTLMYTIVARFLLFLVMTVLFVPFIISCLIPKRWRENSRLYFWLVHCFYYAVLKVSLLPIEVVGKEHLPKKPAIFVANHQSSLDIPLLGILVGGFPHIWLAKHELMQSPILRFVLPQLAVLIDMSTPVKGMRSLLKAVNKVYGKQRHAMIFPEGARHTDGRVHDFYAGFAILAKKTGNPVVPVRIFNVHKVYPPDSFLVYRHPVKVVIGPSFTYQDNEGEDAFRDRVHQWFIEQER